MPYTYSGDPATTNRDAVRFLSRDYLDGKMRLSDEEVDWLITQEPTSIYLAAAMACDMIIQRGLSSKTVGDMTLNYDIASYEALAKSLRARESVVAYPIATSLPHSGDGYVPYFELGMHNYK